MFDRLQPGGATGVEGELTVESQVEALFAEFGDEEPPVVILVASRADMEVMSEAEDELAQRGIDHHTIVVPNPQFAVHFAETAALRGVRVIICASSYNAPLTTLVALHTDVPVVGVPLSRGSLNGWDSLIATAQSTPGSPVACMAVDGARNAAIFATHVLNALPLGPR